MFVFFVAGRRKFARHYVSARIPQRFRCAIACKIYLYSAPPLRRGRRVQVKNAARCGGGCVLSFLPAPGSHFSCVRVRRPRRKGGVVFTNKNKDFSLRCGTQQVLLRWRSEVSAQRQRRRMPQRGEVVREYIFLVPSFLFSYHPATSLKLRGTGAALSRHPSNGGELSLRRGAGNDSLDTTCLREYRVYSR